MRLRGGRPVAIAIGIACAFFAHVGVRAGEGAYRIERSVVTGGGGMLAGDTFRLSGTIGQSATAQMSAADFGLHGGFWPLADADAPTDSIFANGFDP